MYGLGRRSPCAFLLEELPSGTPLFLCSLSLSVRAVHPRKTPVFSLFCTLRQSLPTPFRQHRVGMFGLGPPPHLPFLSLEFFFCRLLGSFRHFSWLNCLNHLPSGFLLVLFGFEGPIFSIFFFFSLDLLKAVDCLAVLPRSSCPKQGIHHVVPVRTVFSSVGVASFPDQPLLT